MILEMILKVVEYQMGKGNKVISKALEVHCTTVKAMKAMKAEWRTFFTAAKLPWKGQLDNISQKVTTDSRSHSRS